MILYHISDTAEVLAYIFFRLKFRFFVSRLEICLTYKKNLLQNPELIKGIYLFEHDPWSQSWIGRSRESDFEEKHIERHIVDAVRHGYNRIFIGSWTSAGLTDRLGTWPNINKKTREKIFSELEKYNAKLILYRENYQDVS